jgi:hypothetical protein
VSLAAAGATGAGSLAFTVAANGGAARSGTLVIAGQTFTVNQEAAAPVCSFSVSPTSVSVKKKGGDAKVKISAPDGCSWSAATNTSWIGVKAGDSGSGDGTVTLSVDKNEGPARSGTATVAGQTVAVSQGKDE